MKKLLMFLLIAGVLALAWRQLSPDGKSPFAALSGLLEGFGPTAEDDRNDTPAENPEPTSPPPSVSQATDSPRPQTTSDSISYRTPNLEHRLFKVAEIFLEDRQKAQLVELLASVASQAATPATLKSKALAVALQLDPGNLNAASANSLLKQGLAPDPQATGGTVDSKSLANELWRLASALRDDPKAGDSNHLLAAYVIDVALTLDPENIDLAYELKVLEIDGVTVDWLPVVGDPAKLADAATDESSSPHRGPKGSDALLARKQALVKGLLVRELGGSRFAGQASQMNATAVQVDQVPEMEVTFNQEVGPDMDSALKEVIKFHRLRHQQLPANYRVEIAFEEQYVPKDGPSAAVACALLLESLLTDVEFDPQFAVTGDLNADGSVQAVSGITGKLRGAQHRDCNVLGLPEANSRVLSDLLIINGPQALAETQAFSLRTFDEALALAKAEHLRAEDLQRSIDLFSEVQKVLRAPQGMAMLKNSHVQERLRECVRLAPNHLSARFLFLSATGQAQAQLSFQGSLEYIDRAAAPMLRVLRQGDFQERTAFSSDEFADAATALRRIRSTLDPRTRDICDAIVDYADITRTFVNNRPKSPNGLRSLVEKIQSAGQSVVRAYDTVGSSLDYQEEVIR